jgi:hypothetical protein
MGLIRLIRVPWRANAGSDSEPPTAYCLLPTAYCTPLPAGPDIYRVFSFESTDRVEGGGVGN